MESKEHICHFPRNYGPRRFDYTGGDDARGVEVSELMRSEDVVYNRQLVGKGSRVLLRTVEIMVADMNGNFEGLSD